MMELKTERLVLRPLSMDDLETTHAYAGDAENCRYMLFLPNETLEESAAFLRSVEEEWRKPQPQSYEFAILLGGKHIGAVSVELNEERTEGEMGWVLHRQYHHQGYAFEAALAVRNFAIQKLGVMRLVAHCDDRNEPSYRLMERLSFRLENADGLRTYARTGETARERRYVLQVAD